MVTKNSLITDFGNSLSKRIKISPKILKEDFDMTIFEDIKYSFRLFTDHQEVAKELVDKDPFLITVIIESLKPEYWRRKKYAKQTKVKILSRYTELLYQYLFEEYGEDKGNKLYAEWLKKYRSLWEKEGKRKEIDDYIIGNEMEARYKDRILKRFKDIQKLKRPRFKVERERYYHLQLPLNRVDWRNPYDNIFVWYENGQKFIQRGGSGSSGQRAVNSKFAFGFSLMNRVRPIRSHLFLYSDENKLFFIRKYRSLCLPVYDIGSNYFLSSSEKDKILGGIKLFRWKTLSKIGEIAVTVGKG